MGMIKPRTPEEQALFFETQRARQIERLTGWPVIETTWHKVMRGRRFEDQTLRPGYHPVVITRPIDQRYSLVGNAGTICEEALV